MKHWTIVIEIGDNSDMFDGAEPYTQAQIEKAVTERIDGALPDYLSYRVMETIDAPYGAQHRDGVYIKEVKP